MLNFWPWTNLHELNLDWIIQSIRNQETRLTNFVSLNSIKYADPFQWNVTSQYAQNTLVIDPETGTAYLSLQPVPQGVQIDNTEYWTPVFTLQNFTDALKKAISDFPQQEDGLAATTTIPANSVFFVGDKLCTNAAQIPITSLVIVGSNCTQVSVVDLLDQLTQQISAEATARKQTDSQLTQQISVEATAREQADSRLGKQISTETTARERADTELGAQISAMKSVNTKTVKDYGAKGDGVTDDTHAFTMALSDVGVAIVPPGSYLIGTITLSEKQKILGMSRYKTVLKYQGDSAVFSISGPNCEIADLTIEGNGQASDGIINNGYKDCYLHSLDILHCTQNGINMRPTSTETPTSGVSHLENIRSYLNGKYGILIDNVADVCLIAVECVSNSQQEDNVYANLAIRRCAVKCVNSHFWNINDSAGYKRPKSSIDISSSANDSEFTNCHIEGGRDANLSIGSDCSRNRFTNCMIYASFGAISVWNAGWQTSFIGCTFSGQAPDQVAKPTWDAVFSANSKISRMLCANCVFNTKITSTPVYSSVISGFIDGTLADYLPTTKSDCLVSVINGSGSVETLGY